jgi:hypothetical protein
MRGFLKGAAIGIHAIIYEQIKNNIARDFAFEKRTKPIDDQINESINEQFDQ